MKTTTPIVNTLTSDAASRVTLRLTSHQILEKFYQLNTGEKRTLFLRSCGLSDAEQEQLWLCPTFPEKDDLLKRLFPKVQKLDRSSAKLVRAKNKVIEVAATVVPNVDQPKSVGVELVRLPTPPCSDSKMLMVTSCVLAQTAATQIGPPNWQENVIPLVNAHFPHDRSATIYATKIKKWIPEIKAYPKYSTFLVAGLLNGAKVELIAYVNRAGKSLYVGDHLVRHRAGCRVIWRAAILGRLPFTGEKIPLTVLNITPCNLLT